MKKCKLCETSTTELASSHIIPLAFWRRFDVSTFKLYSKDSFSRRYPSGIYDRGILCCKCELKYQTIDNEAAKLLLNDFDKIKKEEKPQELFSLPNSYYNPIKRFLLFTLLKAHYSTHDAYRPIKLGEYEDKIKGDILSDRSFCQSEYRFIMHIINNPRVSSAIFKMKRGGFFQYVLLCAEYMFYVRVSDRSITRADNISLFQITCL